jgi:hypothetical protein
MAEMRRSLAAVAASLGVLAAVPAVAPATLSEIGLGKPDAAPSCPARPCLAVSRTTGFQAKVGTNRGTHVAQFDGRIVAWTISLGKPGKKQTAFFNEKLGGEPVAQITVLNPRRKLRFRAVAQGEPQKLTPYFGQTVQFPLTKSIPIKKGQIVALTVPTWAPALAVGLDQNTAWRASRPRAACGDVLTPTAQIAFGALTQYECVYPAVRLAYGATVIDAPAGP